MEVFVQGGANLGADVSTSSTSYQQISDLSFTVKPNMTYFLFYYLLFRCSLFSVKLDLDYPAGLVTNPYNIYIPSLIGGIASITQGVNSATDGVLVPAANTDYIATIQGVIKTGANVGAVVPKFASNNVLSTCTIKAGSGLALIVYK